jgi:hypothetical protein
MSNTNAQDNSNPSQTHNQGTRREYESNDKVRHKFRRLFL